MGEQPQQKPQQSRRLSVGDPGRSTGIVLMTSFTPRLLAVLVSTVIWLNTAFAQQPAEVPLWAKPSGDSKADLGRAARALGPAVFIVGMTTKEMRGHGTAWVISKKHRLLVTNAHVADMFHTFGGKMLAIPNGGETEYKVEKVWYHPGVRRYLKGSPNLSVRSADPKEGSVDPGCPDLALLQLAPGGPELDAEFVPATTEELRELMAQPAAILGFPGHDNDGLPGRGEKAAATFHDGVISRVTDFNLRATAAAADLQFLQYTMSTWGGFSGSPVILPSGRVAAVHNMARSVARNPDAKDESRKEVSRFAHGVRVDCVLEMLAHHGLEDKVPFAVDKTKLDIKKWTDPDERSERARADYAKAEALADEAFGRVGEAKFQEAEELCNESLKLAPTCADAYLCRAYALNGFAATKAQGLPVEKKDALYDLALQNLKMYQDLMPSDPRGVVFAAFVVVNRSTNKPDRPAIMKALELLTKLLEGVSLPDNAKADAYAARAAAHHHLGNAKAALPDFNEAIRILPVAPALYDNRAEYWAANGRPDLVAADRAKAAALRAPTALRITELTEGGAAAKAGLQMGDVIVSVDGTPARTFESLVYLLGQGQSNVEIKYLSKATGKVEILSVQPVVGKIGVVVDVVPYK
jgi:tetratricopeptide (TPR) repeat protein